MMVAVLPRRRWRRGLAPLILTLAFAGCRSGALAPEADGLDAFIGSAEARAASPASQDGAPSELAAFHAKTEAILAAWDQKLAHRATLTGFGNFTSEADAVRIQAARAPDFAARLGSGLGEPDLLAAAYARSPRIQAAWLKLRGTVDQYAQVTALDTILSQYASFQRASRTRVGMPLAGEEMSQHFPFPGSLELKAALVRHAVEEARAHYEGVVRDVIVEAHALFARYLFVGRAIEISETTIGLLDQLEEAARSKLSAGTGAKGAAIQAQVELAKVRNDLLTLRQDRAVLQAAVARLVDVPADTKVGVPVPSPLPAVPPDEATLRKTALAKQPDILEIEARVRRMQTMIELAEQTAYPPFSAGLSTMEGVSHATGGSEKEREPFTTRSKTKPDPFFGTKEAYLREARDAVRAAAARARATRNRTTFAVQRTRAAYVTARRLYALYRDVQLAQAEQAYRDASSGYAADRAAFLDVVDTLRRWLRFRLEADRAVRDLRVAHAQLEGAVGERLGGG